MNGTYKLSAPDGSIIAPSDVMTYLGAAIYADGGIKSELNRRIGTAWADFSKLARLWRHTNLPKSRKLQIFNAIIASRLLYSLSSAWLNVAEIRRLNGFQCRCLRAIMGIKASFISRVPNTSVLQQSAQVRFGQQLLRQQLILYGRIARATPNDPLRKLTFVPGTLQSAANRYVRRVGRPRNEWAAMLAKECCKMGGDTDNIILIEADWRRAVYQYCMN